MKLFGKRRSKGDPALARTVALGARPTPTPVLRRETAEDGKLRITVRFNRPKWQQALGAGPLAERTFALDAYGQEVYAACDGKATVTEIVGRFAESHKLGPAEAELAVTAFMKTLMAKGLVAMLFD